MIEHFKTNPQKAASKISINNNLMAVCLAIFGIFWATVPEKLTLPIIIQFAFAIPLFYVSSIAYTKIAYWKQVKFWDYLGWFTGITATAFVLNIIAILIFILGYKGMALVYFLVLWSFLVVYTVINIHYNPQVARVKIFKLLFFIFIQLIFGVGTFYF
ncbi:hypothetical protein ACFL0A_01070 [Patescibacteria group bacterium]